MKTEGANDTCVRTGGGLNWDMEHALMVAPRVLVVFVVVFGEGGLFGDELSKNIRIWPV